MGDMPLYVALDSVDVWTNKRLFKLDENFAPTKVAGVPPDYFCADGQLWGNPVYDYEEHKKDNFAWWANRLKRVLKIFDLVRIDHFRGLDRYYQVDSDKTNAREGEWVKVPSIELFRAIHEKVNKNKIIAEDLGIIDDGVRELLKHTGYPGMKILSFAFNGDKDNLYLPENIEENYVCYTGTHDNDTLLGLVRKFNEWDYNNLISGVSNSLKLFNIKADLSNNKNIVKAIIELGFATKAGLFILPMQDVLCLDDDYRINQPGKVLDNNWAVKLNKSQVTAKAFVKIKSLTKKYNR